MHGELLLPFLKKLQELQDRNSKDTIEHMLQYEREREKEQ